MKRSEGEVASEKGTEGGNKGMTGEWKKGAWEDEREEEAAGGERRNTSIRAHTTHAHTHSAALCGSSSLKYLGLASNRVGDRGASAMARMLQRNRSLTELRLVSQLIISFED